MGSNFTDLHIGRVGESGLIDEWIAWSNNPRENILGLSIRRSSDIEDKEEGTDFFFCDGDEYRGDVTLNPNKDNTSWKTEYDFSTRLGTYHFGIRWRNKHRGSKFKKKVVVLWFESTLDINRCYDGITDEFRSKAEDILSIMCDLGYQFT